MMSRRRPRRPPRNVARRSTRGAWPHPVCDRSWSKTRIRWRARRMSSSIALTCSATVASSTLRGPGGGSGVTSADMEEAIAVPTIEPRPCAVADLAGRKTPQVCDALEHGPASIRPGERFAVDEQIALIVEKLRARIEAQPEPCATADEALAAQNAHGRGERDHGLGLGQM